MIDPDYPHIVLAFDHKGWRVEVEKSELKGCTTYSVWVNYDLGCAVAVPYAASRQEAIRLAKQWIDDRQAQNKS
ncbi:MAG: hypothetical protein AAF329_10025 [Cyanobacteria bacterium P01_A01_bin.17]